MHFGICLDRFDRPRHARVVSFNRLQIFTTAPVVRIELEAIQAIVIGPIFRILSVVSVVFPYDRPDRLVLFVVPFWNTFFGT